MIIKDLTVDYEQAFRSLSILTLVVEHFFEHAWSLCHAVHAAICPAADAHNTGDSKEDDKCILHLLHTHKSPDPTASVRYANLQWPVKPPTAPISPEDLQELQEWQRQYCGGVRQRSVRDISKYDAGTLPSFANAEEMNQAEVTSSRMHFEGEQCGDENVVEAVNGQHHPVQVLFQKGVVLAVKPEYDMFAPDDKARANFYITMTESDVFDNPKDS